jgi:hypothetical protein
MASLHLQFLSLHKLILIEYYDCQSQNQKPDIAAYSEFIWSGYKRTDGGTSVSCPLAAGVAAALREDTEY